MTDREEEIADLKRKLAQLEARVPPPAPRMPTEQEVREYQSKMHAAAEARMNHAAHFTREELAAMERACPTAAIQDEVRHGGLRPPSGHGASGTITAVRGPSGVYPSAQPTTGWVRENPIGPPPGVRYADKIMDAADRTDRVELAQRLAREKLATGQS
jgi:hypothetical protein